MEQLNEAILRAVLDTVAEGIVTIDASGEIIMVNHEAARMWGYSVEQLIGQQLELLMPPSYRERHRTGLQRYLEHGNALIIGRRVELEGLRSDGSLFPVELVIQETRLDTQRLFTAAVRDISERRRSERRVVAQYAVSNVLAEAPTLDRATPMLLQKICENLDWQLGALWVVDAGGAHLRCIELWHGLPEAEVSLFAQLTRQSVFTPGQGLPGRVWESGTAHWIANVSQDPNFPRLGAAAAVGLHGGVAFPIRDGQTLLGVMEFFSQNVRPPDAPLMALMETIGNQIGQYMARKRAEEAALTEHERYRVTLAGIGDAVIATDIYGRVTFMNAVAQQLTGWTLQEAAGQPSSQVFHIVTEHTRTTVESPIDKVLEHGNAVGLANHTLLLAKDGREIPVDDSGAPIRDSSGTIIGAVLVFRDVTERRRTEHALREQAEIIETVNRIGQMLSAELQLDKLVQAVVEAATELVGAHFGAFFYNVVDAQGEHYTLYSIAGVDRSAFERFPMPRNTELFGPTFRGEGVIRIADVRQDPRHGKNRPHYGMPKGHLPVRSYLAVPVVSRSGEVIGGLFFGHPEPGVFTERVEQLVVGLASQAAVAMDNARLFESLNTERLKAETSERYYRTLAETIPALVWTTDAAGSLNYISQRWNDYTGQDLEQSLGTGWQVVLHPDDVPLVLERWSTALQHGTPYSVEARYRRADGAYRWHLARALPVRDTQGRILTWFGTSTDIEEQKHAEARLRFLSDISTALASSLDYEITLQRIASLAVPEFADWCIVDVLDEQQQIRRVAHAAADPARLQLLQEIQQRYPPSWDSAQPSTRVLRSGTALLIEELSAATLREHTNDPRHLELVQALAPQSAISVPLKSREQTLGVVTFVRINARPRYQQADLELAEELARRAATAVDNARLHQNTLQAEERLRQQATRMQALAEASRALAAARLDLYSILETIARQLAESIGDVCIINLLAEDGQRLDPVALHSTSAADLLRLREMLASTPQAADEGLAGRVVQTGQPVLIQQLTPALSHMLKPEYRPTIEQLELSSMLMVPLALQEQVIGVLFLARHASRPSYTEEDQAFLQDLADRTSLAIANARLYEAAQQALEIRDRFLSIAAHELRTPMTSILGYTQLLQRRIGREQPGTARTHEIFEILNAQVRRLNRLSLSLLDLSHIQRGQFTVEREVVDVAALARQLVLELKPTLDRHTLQTSIPEQPVPIEGDVLRLEQVLYNLLQNALKYSPSGGSVELRIEQRASQVIIQVNDQGMGIPAADLPLLFQRFFRAGNVNGQQISGMGLGLSVVKEIVTLHGGSIEVASEEGRGSCFTIYLPARAGALVEEVPESQQAPG